MSEQFNSLEAIGEQFKRGDDVETEAQFAKGAILVSAANQGWDVDECAGYCALLTLRTKRTVYRYYSTVRTFPRRVYDLPYEHHALAADTIDYRKTMTEDELNAAQANALDWLKQAKAEQWSTRALRAAISAAGGRVEQKPEVLLDGVEAVIGNLGNDWFDVLLINNPLPIGLLQGIEVKITLVRSLAVEKAKQA